jgi:hypothetical protein
VNLLRKARGKRHLRAGWVLVVLLLGQAGGTIVAPLDFLALHERAGRLFHGRCLERREIVDGVSFPCTEYTFEVIEAVKGCRDPEGRPRKRVTFRHVGTRKAHARPDGLVVPPLRLGLPEYEPGEEVVLFLTKDSRAGLCSPVGLPQGHFRVHRLKERGTVLVKNGLNNKGLFRDVPLRAFEGLEKKAAAALGREEGGVDLESFLELCRKVRKK